MRSLEEIDRDFAGMHSRCEKQSHGCTYPQCTCSRAGAVPLKKHTAMVFTITTLRPTEFVVLDERTGDRWRGTADGTFVRDDPAKAGDPQ